jgi:hypothetical protein
MRKLILTLIVSAFAFSCNDRLEELNRPKKDAAEVPADALFTSGVRHMFDMMVSTNVNENVFRLYAQYWAQTTYPDESQYNMVGRQIPDQVWQNAYRDALRDFSQAKLRVEETAESLGLSEAEKNNQIAIIDACMVYTYSVLVDNFGAVPFTEAINDDILVPAYETGQSVYDNIIQILDNAIASMSSDAAAFNPDQDRVYWGDVEKWMKFANSLKLKLAMTIADVDASKATTMATQAVAGGVFESNEDNTVLAYLEAAPNTNPVWEDLVQSGRADYVIANTIVDKMNALDDPRLPIYAEPMDGGIFKGGVYGTANTYADNSHIGDLFHQPDLEGIILDYAEVEFLLAEAVERGIAVGGTAAEHYEAGIRASMEYWGVDGGDIDTYLANPDVAYGSATGDWTQKIGTQAWLALYNRGFEGWTLWRRLDFSGFNIPPGLSESDIPRRMIFPIKEATLNPSNLDAAIGLIGGSDDVQTKVFWDVN